MEDMCSRGCRGRGRGNCPVRGLQGFRGRGDCLVRGLQGCRGRGSGEGGRHRGFHVPLQGHFSIFNSSQKRFALTSLPIPFMCLWPAHLGYN
jgi:hypothetical protein